MCRLYKTKAMYNLVYMTCVYNQSILCVLITFLYRVYIKYAYIGYVYTVNTTCMDMFVWICRCKYVIVSKYVMHMQIHAYIYTYIYTYTQDLQVHICR